MIQIYHFIHILKCIERGGGGEEGVQSSIIKKNIKIFILKKNMPNS